jgi:ribose/xylose/arabinose/galactoside ABC-type transport system permease subunit
MDTAKIKKLFGDNIVVLVLIALVIGFTFGNNMFFTPNNIMNLLGQMCLNALLATGLTYVIILGGIDISVGSTMAITGIVAAQICLKIGAELSVFSAMAIEIIVGIVVGAILGAFIGWLVAYRFLVPMICTLAMMSALRGLAYIISGGGPVYGLPNSFAVLGSGRIIQNGLFPNGMIPILVIFTIIVVAVFHAILTKTVFGRQVFAVGSAPQVAHMCGINVKKVTLQCYVICGICAGLAGIAAASKINNGHPATGVGFEMFAIASTVLGGTSLLGGSGSIARAMFGVAIIAVINNGMTLMGISAYWQQVVIGTIIILAVLLDMAQKNAKKD